MLPIAVCLKIARVVVGNNKPNKELTLYNSEASKRESSKCKYKNESKVIQLKYLINERNFISKSHILFGIKILLTLLHGISLC